MPIIFADIFNEIINEFEFDDDVVNMASLTNDTLIPALSPNEFYTKIADDPLLSSSSTSMNYNLPQVTSIIQSPKMSPTIQEIPAKSAVNQQIYLSQGTHFTSSNVMQQPTTTATTLVYQISNNSICSVPLTTASPQQQQQQQPSHHTAHIINNVTPVQMVFSENNETMKNATVQPTQRYRKIMEKSEMVPHQSSVQILPTTTATVNQMQQFVAIQTTEALTDKTNIDDNKTIIINPTALYTATEPDKTNQNIQLINGMSILTTNVPTIMVNSDNQQKIQIDRVAPPKVKEVKRSTHNAIERRYRTSINDKIVELKTMLVGPGGKLNKSAILKQSIDKINDLENENYDLKMENARLRDLFNGNANAIGDNSTLKHLLLQKPVNQQKRRNTQSSIASSSDYTNGMERMTPPPTSDESNPSLSPARSDNGSMPPSPLAELEITTEISRSFNDIDQPPAKRGRKSTKNVSSSGMSTHSKLALCVFMFAIITINPLATLLSASGWSSSTLNTFESPIGTSRRNILATENVSNIFANVWNQITESALIFTINFIILIACFIKLFVYGDPIMNSRSPVASEYLKQKQIADDEFNRGNGEMAFIAYEKCLEMFGVNLPKSWFEMISMTLWQFLRCCLHRIHIGQWLSRKYSRLVRTSETQTDALSSAHELAFILNRCNQIHFSRKMRNGFGLLLTMYAVNMAEVSSNMLPLNLIEIYLTSALKCRRNYPYFCSWICSRYYLYKAKSESFVLCGQQLPLKYNWIFNNAFGYKYICKYSFDKSTEITDETDEIVVSLFSSCGNSLDPLLTVYRVSFTTPNCFINSFAPIV